MRKPIIITLCTIFFLAVTPFTIGMLAQKHYNTNIAQQTSTQFVFTNKDYVRGWLQSTATTQLDINDTDLLSYYQKRYKTDKPLQIIIQHHIQHGPLLFTDNGIRFGLASTQDDIHFSDATASEIKQLTQGKEPATASSVLHFSGQAVINLDIAAITMKNRQEHIQFAPTSMQLTVSEASHRLHGSIHNADIQITEKETTLQIKNLYIDIDQYQQNSNPLGKWHVSLKTAQLSKHGQTLLDMNQFSSTSTLDNQKNSADLLSFTQKTSIGTFLLQQKTYGPGTFNMSTSNIPAKALTDMAYNMTNPIAPNTIAPLLSQGLNINIDTLQLTTPQGDVLGQLSAQLPSIDAQQLQNLAYLRANSDISLELSAPIAFIDSTPLVAQLPLMLMFGIIENKDGMYSTKAILHQGKLQLNGKEMSF